MKAKEYVVELLESYPHKKRQIEQLRFELQNLPKINDDEIISSLALGSSMNSAGSISSGSISDKTMMIALKYRDVGESLMSETASQILHELDSIEKEIIRLELYLSMIGELKATTIRMHYFEGKTLSEMARELDVARGTVLSRKNAAIAELASMYEFLLSVKDPELGQIE